MYSSPFLSTYPQDWGAVDKKKIVGYLVIANKGF